MRGIFLQCNMKWLTVVKDLMPNRVRRLVGSSSKSTNSNVIMDFTKKLGNSYEELDLLQFLKEHPEPSFDKSREVLRNMKNINSVG